MSEERLKDLFLSLMAMPSPSGQEGRVAQALKKRLSDIGFEVFVDQAGKVLNGEAGNIIAKRAGRRDWDTVLLCAHMDTVTPVSPGAPVIENGVISSPGNGVIGIDDKAGIAAIIEGVQRMIETVQEGPPIEIVLTVQEEVGLKGSRQLDMTRLDARCGFVLDSGSEVGEITIGSPEKRSLEFLFTGRASHAGVEPEKGVSAIVAASKAIAGMPLGRISAETTANIGLIQGGAAKNIVPETTRLVGEARSFSEDELARTVEAMVMVAQKEAESMGATVQFNENRDYPAIHLNEEESVVQLAASAIRKMGLEPRFSEGGGGSDAVILTTKGIPCVNLGMGVKNAHTSQEHISLKELEKTAQLVFQLLTVNG